MASLYERPNSRYFWVNWRDPATGLVKRESTGVRVDAPAARTRAKGILVEKQMLESQARAGGAHRTRALDRKGKWDWVAGYLAERYAKSPKTLSRAKNAWSAWSLYLEHRRVPSARALAYRIAAEFAAWRTGGGGGREIHHNTAVVETKFMGVILREAVKRGLAAGNVVRELELRRVPTREKREISPEHQTAIEKEIGSKDDFAWMRDHWLVLMKTGCRCIEACVELAEISFADSIMPLRIKGGDVHRVPMHPELVALARARIAAGEKFLVDPRPNMARAWWRLFERLKLPYSIHCTRVTVITRLLRAGHTVAQVCQLVGHSEEVNVIYRRLNAGDVRHLLAGL